MQRASCHMEVHIWSTPPNHRQKQRRRAVKRSAPVLKTSRMASQLSKSHESWDEGLVFWFGYLMSLAVGVDFANFGWLGEKILLDLILSSWCFCTLSGATSFAEFLDMVELVPGCPGTAKKAKLEEQLARSGWLHTVKRHNLFVKSMLFSPRPHVIMYEPHNYPDQPEPKLVHT